MKKNIILILLITLAHIASAHFAESNEPLQHYTIGNKKVDGYFTMLKNNEVYIETSHHHILHFPLASFPIAQQQIFTKRYDVVAKLNTEKIAEKPVIKNKYFNFYLCLEILMLGIFILLSIQLYKAWFVANQLKFVYPVLMVGVAIIFMSADKITRSTTDPLQVDKAFIPFKPNVYTHWDASWFYVESKGIPTTHGMMVGIGSSGWQQQVPLPHCYTGANAWQIPLNPTTAAMPVAVNANHFTKGAIAMAVNGVPIFNPYTNTGADAFLTGQLDNFGGHCGRGDDYHYHTAPLHLYTSTADTLPIAYALDGYAVRGAKEFDGTAMAMLDANHGHNYGGVYHYHGSAAAPYMIANMVGTVTEDANKQIVPQPQGQPVRTENWTPLNGAVITSCTPNGTGNGYNLTYTLNGTSGYGINYSWLGTTYTFNYVTPSNTITTTYTGPNLSACNLPNGIANDVVFTKNLVVYPNPATEILQIKIENNKNNITKMLIVNMQGNILFTSAVFVNKINIEKLAVGQYILCLQIDKKNYTTTFEKIVK